MIDYHRDLLADERRTRAYRDAIARVVRPGDVVVDLGCGTGILSFFACQAGASRVYAIDRTHMADVALLLAGHLGLRDRISVVHEDSSTIELPEHADVLVTETMGAFGFDEGILGSVLDARARLLRPGARLIPARVGVSIAPMESGVLHDEHVAWWTEPRYGLDLSPLRLFASSSLLFDRPRAEDRLAEPIKVIEVDLASFESTQVAGHARFSASRDALLHGFSIRFHAALAAGIEFGSDETAITSWRSGLLPLEEALPVSRDASIEVGLETDDGRVWRWNGSAGGHTFDQTTWLAMPPCTLHDPRKV